MPNLPLEGIRVAILATDGVEEAELAEPRKALDEAGATTTLIAPKPGRIQAMRHDERSKRFKVDATLDEEDPDDYDAVLLPGGALNADALRVDERAQQFVRRIDEAGKPLAAICHAPWLLISAGMLAGRTITGYHTIRDDVRNAGGTWQDEQVVRDGNWLSSRQPSDIAAFSHGAILLFAERRREGDAAAAH